MQNLEINKYKITKLTEDYYKSFEEVYLDFKNRSKEDYKFELEPLEYFDFLDCISKNLMDCLILLEDEKTTAFLISTTMISESIEINIIHCLGNENVIEKQRALISEFIEINKHLLKTKICTYPMLGEIQSNFAQEITHFNFKLTGTAVVRFQFFENNSLLIFKNIKPVLLPDEKYKIVSWKDGKFLLDAFSVMYDAFHDSYDALFDYRFKTKTGIKDVINKITSGIYGNFLEEYTKVLLYNNKPVGFCFCNITGGKIGNIPLIGICKEHFGKNLGKILLYNTISDIITGIAQEKINLTEINATVDTDNHPAVRMYRYIGFKEDYCYPQAYTTLD